MNLKLCAIGAMVYGLKSISHPRSTKTVLVKSGSIGQSTAKQVSFNANDILDNYGRALVVESNLK